MTSTFKLQYEIPLLLNQIVSIGQSVATNSDVTFNSVSASSLTIGDTTFNDGLITADNINKRQDVSTQIVFTLIEKLYHMIKNDLTTELSIFKYLKIDIIKSECLIPHNILLMIEEIKELTKFNKTMLLTVGIGYDPNKDLENIIQNGERDQTDIDLVFRSGGEKRLSGFFPFHTMHSELVFVDKLWPDIRLKDINDAVIEYERRDRRFGK